MHLYYHDRNDIANPSSTQKLVKFEKLKESESHSVVRLFKNTGVGSLSLPNPGIKPRFPILQEDSLPAEPQGKPKNTGVGNLSLLQRIFLTQELNQGLLHYRQVLYQLSYQGSPKVEKMRLL